MKIAISTVDQKVFPVTLLKETVKNFILKIDLVSINLSVSFPPKSDEVFETTTTSEDFVYSHDRDVKRNKLLRRDLFTSFILNKKVRSFPLTMLLKLSYYF